ncbi:12160_t:CDS:10, partial [Cetraspora pellucida]
NVFKNPLDHEHVDNNQQEESVNCDHEINEETEGSVSSDQQSINDISDMLEQATLTKNADDDCEEDIDLIEDKSPEWSECNDCYGSGGEFCESCGCSPPLKRIPAGKWYCDECKPINLRRSLRKLPDNSNDEGRQYVRKSSKKTKSNRGKRRKTSLDTENETNEHANNSIDNMMKGIKFPTIFIDNERVSIRQRTDEIANVPIIQSDINAQRTDEIENTPVIQSDINTQESILQHDNSRSSLSLHSENQIEGSIDHEDNMSNEDDMSFEDSQSLQPDQNETKKYTDIQINGDPIPIMIYNDAPNILKEIFKKIFDTWIEFSNFLPVPSSLPEAIEIEEEENIESQIKNIWEKISNNEESYNYSRVLYIHTLCALALISFKVTKRIKELKKSNQFFVPSHITVIDQDTGEEIQEVNPEANNWNREFAKGERVASRVNKILVESATIYHKGKPAIIKNEMVAARRLVILVQRLGWQVIYDSESIDPPRLKHMSKKEWVDLIKKIEEKEPTDNIDFYKLSDESLKELEESF